MVENVRPTQTWEALKPIRRRSWSMCAPMLEWNFVGVPDLAAAGKQAVLIPWQVYPTMQRNAGFEDQLKEAGLTPEHHIYFICRSGARSMAAAQAAQRRRVPARVQCRRRVRGRCRTRTATAASRPVEGRRPALAAALTATGSGLGSGPSTAPRPPSRDSGCPAPCPSGVASLPSAVTGTCFIVTASSTLPPITADAVRAPSCPPRCRSARGNARPAGRRSAGRAHRPRPMQIRSPGRGA